MKSGATNEYGTTFCNCEYCQELSQKVCTREIKRAKENEHIASDDGLRTRKAPLQ